MMGYPFSYGDSNEHKIKLINFNKINYQVSSLKVLTIALMLGVSPAFAAEPATGVVAANNVKEISQASLALTYAVCTAAGAVCKGAAENVAHKNPKLLVPFGCVALISWCAAKASPL